MGQAQISRTQPTRSGTSWGTVVAALVALAIVAVLAYYVIVGSYGGASPNTPYNTAAPATGVPGTAAPAPTYHYP